AQPAVLRARSGAAASAACGVGGAHFSRGDLLARGDRPLRETRSLAAWGISVAGGAALAIGSRLLAVRALGLSCRRHAEPQDQTRREDPRIDVLAGRIYQSRSDSVLAIRDGSSR